MWIRALATFVKEPVLITNVVAAVIGMVVVLGLSVPAGLEAALVALLVSVATLISRAFVTPV